MPAGETSSGARIGSVLHHILVVEDDPVIAGEIRNVLEQANFEVRVATDGGQAQLLFTMREPDLVLLDLILPGESGFEVCERFKHRNDAVPIVILSAITMTDSQRLADRVGANAYLTKPCQPAMLLKTIRDVAETNWERTHFGAKGEEERIRFFCRCGKKFRVSRVHRGRSMTCPQCGEPVIVPLHE